MQLIALSQSLIYEGGKLHRLSAQSPRLIHAKVLVFLQSRSLYTTPSCLSECLIHILLAIFKFKFMVTFSGFGH